MGFFKEVFKALTNETREDAPPKRDDPCWCGSGREYKACHFERDRIQGMGSRSCGPGG